MQFAEASDDDEHRARHAALGQVIDRSLADDCRRLRAARGWTQKELARRAGLHVGTILDFEKPTLDHGRFSMPTIAKIAHAFDVALMARFSTWAEAKAAYAMDYGADFGGPPEVS